MPLKESTQFAVVLFPNWTTSGGKISTELVPVSWLDEIGSKWFCAYPLSKDYSKVPARVKEEKRPDPTWISYEVEILKEAKNYDKGLKRLNKSFFTADILSSTENDEGLASGLELDENNENLPLDENALALALDEIPRIDLSREVQEPMIGPNDRRKKRKITLEVAEDVSIRTPTVTPTTTTTIESEFVSKTDLAAMEERIKNAIRNSKLSLQYDIKES
ncbi:hypothetical protein TKK_0018296 [Trichogramma kaykai]|uniref:Uncharacterized protein n=1 Tax=Trichogramma kaykai TaxID=54128 RepID=A0ABD2VZ43_9HYME